MKSFFLRKCEKTVLPLFVSTGLMLVVTMGCSDDSSNFNTAGGSSEDAGIIAAATLDDLPNCSENSEGSVVYVKDQKKEFVCFEGDWIVDEEELNSSATDEFLSSSQKQETSSSSKKVESSSSSQKQKSSSSSTKIDSSSSSTKIGSSSSSTKIESSSSVEEVKSSCSSAEISSSSERILVVKGEDVTGTALKGPFVKGSAVTIYELDANFVETGVTFKDKVLSDNGDYIVKDVSLENSVAVVEVNGAFYNEITGEKTSDPITLLALVDLENRHTVNVNVLTHMEYSRVMYLVKTGMNFQAAKKQAESELLKIFGFETGESNFEDLNLFDDSDEVTALLTISVLMLGDRSEVELKEFLRDFQLDFEKDGTVDAARFSAALADGVALVDLQAVQENIWKINSVAPIAELADDITAFWRRVYGFDKCDILGYPIGENSLLMIENVYSKRYGKSFVCWDDQWREVLSNVSSFGNCTNALDDVLADYTRSFSELQFGIMKDSQNADVPYVCTRGGWAPISIDLYDSLYVPSVCPESGSEVTSNLTGITYACNPNSIGARPVDNFEDVKEEISELFGF